MAENDIDVAYVAKLARLALTANETERFGAQLADLLGHVAALSQLDLGDVPATAQVVPSRNVTRDDELRPSLDRETVLRAAPQREGPYFRVPRIIGDEIADGKAGGFADSTADGIADGIADDKQSGSDDSTGGGRT